MFEPGAITGSGLSIHFERSQLFFSVLSPWRGSAHQITLFTFLNFYSFLCLFLFFVCFLFCFTSADLKLYESSGVGKFLSPVKVRDICFEGLESLTEFLHLTRGVGFLS